MVPLSLLMFAAAFQVGMWYQARNMCQAAAQAGVQAGMGYDASSEAGSQAATSYLRDTAGTSIASGSASEQLTLTTVTVTCTAHAFTLVPIPGLTSVNQSATASREIFTTPGDL
jgi:Flp pilus assembly protein TadG